MSNPGFLPTLMDVRGVFLPEGGHMSVFDDGVVEVPVETLLDVRNILHLKNIGGK